MMSKLQISPKDKVVFVTGSNRGIGKAIAMEFLEKGAKKVYAAARNPNLLKDLKEKYKDRLVPVKLDLIDDSSIAEAVKKAADVEILINNAGMLMVDDFFSSDSINNLKKQLEVNVFGLLKLTNSVINILKKQPIAAIVNVSSVAAFANMPMTSTYSATKAAVHSITQGMRREMMSHGLNILVFGVYPGATETDMTKDFSIDKESPENVAKNIIQGLIEGKDDIFPDPMSKQLGKTYMNDPKAVERQLRDHINQRSY